MSTLTEIINYIKFGRAELLKAVQGLSQQELTQLHVYDEWSVRDVLAHILGWDKRTLHILPLMIHNQADSILGIEVQSHNRQSVAAGRQMTVAEILAEAETVHNQILELLSSLDYTEIDRRHERRGRIVTIRSYIIDIMVEHERRHAAEIVDWRTRLEQAIDPLDIKQTLHRKRDEFMAALKLLDESTVSQKPAAGGWSISDVVGHLADWEQRMLQAARHIHDPSQPTVVVTRTDDELNQIMVDRRTGKSWAENLRDLQQSQQATDHFVAPLTRGDLRLRGPYPWPNDFGTLAELLQEMGRHYPDHLPAVKAR